MASMKAVVMMVAVLALLLALSATVSARPDAHVLDFFHLLSARNHVSDNFATCSDVAAANSILKNIVTSTKPPMFKYLP
ncbi:hypothetical protein FEM48_Zijuj05G0084800 [Ziziphus jujuba var. spinosa]|uniref:Uncharacterized protein n=1 Tax=Ziziphus jujuba var. spinosa TaxID=714518 RepID=A0A978VDW9_ZIZJJ|nr:hypothetical protein FEM48_Zijuj05G0084800 [Ziziphus jujuba var. spinosa]